MCHTSHSRAWIFFYEAGTSGSCSELCHWTRDVFAILPTGFGKSLCYACLPAAFDAINKKERGHSIAMIVTPLLAIMKDQVRK